MKRITVITINQIVSNTVLLIYSPPVPLRRLGEEEAGLHRRNGEIRQSLRYIHGQEGAVSPGVRVSQEKLFGEVQSGGDSVRRRMNIHMGRNTYSTIILGVLWMKP
jgi:hypothetical protein